MQSDAEGHRRQREQLVGARADGIVKPGAADDDETHAVRTVDRQPLDQLANFKESNNCLANTDIVRQLLVRCFDAHYYGKTNLSSLLDRSLDRQNRPERVWLAFHNRAVQNLTLFFNCFFQCMRPDL